jgi:hypothetical protein
MSTCFSRSVRTVLASSAPIASQGNSPPNRLGSSSAPRSPERLERRSARGTRKEKGSVARRTRSLLKLAGLTCFLMLTVTATSHTAARPQINPPALGAARPGSFVRLVEG